MTKRRVLIAVSALTLGGSERQASVVACNLDRSRFEAHIVCLRSGGIRTGEVEEAGIPIHVFPVTSFRRPHALTEGLRLARFIRRERFDLVHTFDPPATIFATPFARLSGRCKVLSSMRSHRDLRTPGMRRMLRFTDRLVDGIVVNCKSVQRHLQQDEGVAEERIRLCYNALDVDQFHPGNRARATEFGGDGGPIIGTVCGLRQEKGLGDLIDAFAQVSRDRPEVRLTIVGSGPELSALQSRAVQSGAAQRILFVPEARDVARLLRGIDIFVLPSYSEALSNSLMEAMASGCCSVASEVGGNVELIENGRSGLTFPAGDAQALATCLGSLIDSPELANRLAAAARERMEQDFSLAASLARMESIYDETLRG